MRGGSDHPQCNRGRLITHLLMMPGSALNNFIVLLVKIFQAKKKILKIGPLGAEITFMQKIVRKPWYQIGLIKGKTFLKIKGKTFLTGN